MKKGDFSTVIIILIFLVGLSLLLYPTVSDHWNALHQSKAIAESAEQVSNINDDLYEELWEDAREYNRTLADRKDRYTMTEEERKEYESLLNVSGNGIIGYIEIPEIDCRLPIYHGTDAAILQIAVGHIEGTSLPVGGEGTHCALSGHRGLPSAKLFTDLDEMKEGDKFLLRVLDETLTYQVDQILVVEPDDLSALALEEGKDYCTLITCTPYGINTHRMLVRGIRVENEEEISSGRVIADAWKIETVIVTSLASLPMLLTLLLVLLIRRKRRTRKGRKA